MLGIGAAAAGVASTAIAGAAQASTTPPTTPATVAAKAPGHATPLAKLTTVTPDAITYQLQQEWAWCSKCQGLFYPFNVTRGACPAGGVHGDQASYDYGMIWNVMGVTNNPKNPQPNWDWCGKCQGLFTLLHTPSHCPAGGGHDGTGSHPYSLFWGQPSDPPNGIQAGWNWCGKCQGLFFAGHGAGVCPAGGGHAAGSGSYDYDMIFAPGFSITFH